MRLWTNDGEFRVTGWIWWLTAALLTAGVCVGGWFGGFGGTVAGIAPGAGLFVLLANLGDETVPPKFPSPYGTRRQRTSADWDKARLRAALVAGGLVVLGILYDWVTIRFD